MLHGGYSHGETIPNRQYHSSRYISKTATKFWYLPLGCEDWNWSVHWGDLSYTHLAQWQLLTYRNWRLFLPVKTSGDSERAISEARKEPIMTANEARERPLQGALTCHSGLCYATRTRKYASVSCQNCSVMFGLKLLWRCDPLWDFFFVLLKQHEKCSVMFQVTNCSWSNKRSLCHSASISYSFEVQHLLASKPWYFKSFAAVWWGTDISTWVK